MELNLKEILRLKFETGDLIWMWFRFQTLNISKLGKNKKEKDSKIIKLFNFIRSFKYIFFKKKKIVFITSTYFNFKKEENCYINIQDKSYFDVFPEDTQIYEYPDIDMKYRTPNIPKFSSFLFIIEVICLILAKFSLASERKEQIEFNKLVYNNIKLREIKKAEKHIRFLRKGYKIFLKIIKPEIIFINCASYGNKYGLLVSIAKELGIKVAETQHGIIYKKHIAYNYKKEELNKLERYLPNYLLIYGKYWETQINTLSKLIIVGDHRIKFQEKNNQIFKYKYLIVSQWDITNMMINLALNIRKKEKNAKILFRLHPLENLSFDKIKLLKNNDIEISNKERSLEEDMENTINIVGCYSSVLLEALIYRKKIFILDNELSRENFPMNIGLRINEKFEILLEENKKINYNDYWQKNFESLYKNFINNNILDTESINL